MYFAEALGLLAVLTIAAIVLRFYWFRMSPAVQHNLLIGCAVIFSIRFLFLVTQWSTVSSRFNSLLFWLGVVAYEIILVRFSLMRPRWLTSICALILLIPLCGSTLLLPLTNLFDTSPHDVRRIARNYVVERQPWDPKISGRAGDDFMVFYNPSLIPFLHHQVQRSSFSKHQCNTDEVRVNAEDDRKLVHFYCPGYKNESDSIRLTLPLK